MRSLKSRNLGVSKSHDCHQSGKQVQDYLVLQRELDPQQKKDSSRETFSPLSKMPHLLFLSITYLVDAKF